ncbi:hypothetical protein Sps_02766 [Shewanella psychrophila]|uniref:Uncharacterized protein n=1 Tax=Shewanella psychrophila TaxID=225848 RepID=A0A1S6HR03_9GAMM|nr:hypothetical protein [Shewanella psychrophila]AQS37918.1 hypothetical protein Sps_02766 [Shewanella psychrophila]
MLDAICTLDEVKPVTYTVFKFQKLSDDDIEKYRQSLSCPVCNGKAYFRKASKDGKAACFGSRYHQVDCSEFNPSKAKIREELAVIEVNQLLVDSDALVIDFSKRAGGKRASCSSTDKNIIVGSKGNTGLLRTDPENKLVQDEQSGMSRVSSEGLDKLLHSLLRGSELAESDLWVYTDEKYRWRAKNLFVNFADAEPTDNGAPRMYWGTLSHSDKNMHWLNPADCRDVGIPIEDYQEALCKRFDIQGRRDLEGAGIIIFGKCFFNKEKTRKIIQLWGTDINRMAISKLDD